VPALRLRKYVKNTVFAVILYSVLSGMPRQILLFLLLTVGFRAFSQTVAVFTPNNSPAILVDRNSKKTDAPVPFDRDFTLQYPLVGEEIFNVFSFRVRIVSGLRKLDTDRSKPSTFHFLGYDTVTSKGNLLIKISALPPNNMIDVVLLRRANVLEMDTLMTFNEKINSNNDAATNLPINNDLDNGIGLAFGTFIDNNFVPKEYSENPFEKMQYAEYRNLFIANLLPLYKVIKSYNYSDTASTIDWDEIMTLDEYLTKKKIDDGDLLPISRVIRNAILPQLLDGTADISGNYPDLDTPPTKYDKRIVNLGNSLAAVDKAIVVLDRLLMEMKDNDIYDIRKALVSWHKVLTKNKSTLSSNLDKIISFIKAQNKFNREVWLITGNEFNDFTALSKVVVMPDVGMTTMWLKGHDRSFFYPRPFVGINIYLRPVDKTLRERDFAHYNPLRVWSLQVGLTYGDLGNKEFSNLFNDFSLMAGLSYRFNRWFRLGAGTILVTQTDANPLISDTHTHFGGYFSAAVDFDLFSNAGSVRTRVFK
jgi:hypothetical protein